MLFIKETKEHVKYNKMFKSKKLRKTLSGKVKQM